MRSFKIVFLSAAFLIISGFPLFSHGSEYTILSDHVIIIEVKYDTGEFLSHADVLVFPPDEEKSAYTLKTDDKGCFYLLPDKEGTWILQVRGAGGHGIRINLPVDKSMISDGAGSNRLSLLQKLVMFLCVAWGTAGTVLFFRNRI